MMRRGGALLASLLVLALLPSVASATVYVSRLSNGGLYITGSDGDDEVNVTYDESDFYVTSADVQAGMNCTSLQTSTARCPKSFVTYVVFSMGGGNDHWTGGSGGYPLTADGGAGNDTIPAGYANDTIHGGSGDDVILPRGGTDEVMGEAGTDTVDYSELQNYPNDPALIHVLLDDQANDLVRAATSNIHSDVENVIGTIGPDRIEGSAAANRLVAGAGDDTLVAEDSSADVVDCGDGSDSALIDPLDTATGCETLQGSGAPSTTTPTSNTPVQGTPGSDSETPSPPAAGPATLGATIVSRFVARVRTAVAKLVVRNAPPPASIRVSCSGRRKGCRFKTRRVTPTRADTVLTKLFEKARLKPGAVLEIRVTQPGTVGKVFRFAIRRRKPPKLETLCLPPGATTPSSCS